MNPAFSHEADRWAWCRGSRRWPTSSIDDFDHEDRCEFIAEFADPYAARVLAIMLGTPGGGVADHRQGGRDHRPGPGVNIKHELPSIEAALARLYDYADALIADRRRAPEGRLRHRAGQRQSRTGTAGSATPSCATGWCC